MGLGRRMRDWRRFGGQALKDDERAESIDARQHARFDVGELKRRAMGLSRLFFN